MAIINPLIAQPPKEVSLKKAPLVRVIAQIRFPLITSIENKSFIGAFQEAIRDKYPILQQEQTRSLVFGSQGVTQSEQVTWRFVDAQGNWRLSLSLDFVALETTAYTSRSDFISRLENLLIALNEHIKPKIVQRFGVRYIDRLVGQAVNDISKLVRSEITGIVALDFGEYIHQSINESLFSLPGGEDQIIARWGLIPPNGTFDPDAIEPVDEPSWILDLDMSLSKQRDFDVEELLNEAQRFAERIYTFFRWAVTDEFLQHFGGEP